MAPDPSADEKPERMSLYATTVLGAPAGWRWVRASIGPPDAPEDWAKIEGAIMPTRANGSLDWSKRDAATERTFFFKFDEMRDWWDAYCKALGRCPRCWNSGRETAEVSSLTGTKYRPCGLCQRGGTEAGMGGLLAGL